MESSVISMTSFFLSKNYLLQEIHLQQILQ